MSWNVLASHHNDLLDIPVLLGGVVNLQGSFTSHRWIENLFTRRMILSPSITLYSKETLQERSVANQDTCQVSFDFNLVLVCV
jgi:hypothetical protein